MKSYLSLILLVTTSSYSWAQDSLFFKSEKEMANYAFQNTNFDAYNIRFFKDRMFEYNDSVFEFYTSQTPNKEVHAYHAFQLSKHVENWDVSETFNADSILHPVVSRFFCLDGINAFHIPIIIYDIPITELKTEIRTEFENAMTTNPVRSLIVPDFNQKSITMSGLPLDTVNYEHVWLDFDPKFTVLRNNREIQYLRLSDATTTVILYPNQSIDVSQIFRDGVQLKIEIYFDDNSEYSFVQNITYIYSVPQAKGEKSSLTMVDQETIWPYDGESQHTESRPSGHWAISYACSDHVIRKPYLMIAGWGPYTDVALINSTQNWPTSMWKMANQMNQDGLIEALNEQGFDVAILQLFPPNAKIEGNGRIIQECIKTLNFRAAENGYHEEIIVQGFSAGALGAKYALEHMEKSHLDSNGIHPHARLYVSTDGEHLGANLPLGIQFAVQYLWDYESSGYNYPKIYALRYIMRAPQSTQLLRYWYETIDEYGNVSQAQTRTDYMTNQSLADHDMIHPGKYGFPNFHRMISISNGMHTPIYNVNTNFATHPPYPSQPGKVIFEDAKNRHRSKVRYLQHGESEVFLYRKRTWFNFNVVMRGLVNNALVLDNAAGGMMFIKENPLNQALNFMDIETFGKPDSLYFTNFCFTPTVFTHCISDFSQQTVNGYIKYNLREQGLMFTTPDSAQMFWDEGANQYFGYPHLKYPENHYSLTPFDAIFTGPQISEHLRFNYETCNENRSLESFEAHSLEPLKNNYKNFVVDEAEGVNMYLQNRNIGKCKRAGYTYYADFTTENVILMGQEVTYKTDFKPLTVEEQTVVRAMAKNEINLKPGVHFKSGSSVHLSIGELECVKSSDSETQTESRASLSSGRLGKVINKESSTELTIYPNPSVSSFKIRYLDEEITETIHVLICDLNGTVLLESENKGEIVHHLSPGLYIVKIKHNGLWISKQLVVS